LPLPGCFWWGVMCLRIKEIVTLLNLVIHPDINLWATVVVAASNYVAQLLHEEQGALNMHVGVNKYFKEVYLSKGRLL